MASDEELDGSIAGWLLVDFGLEATSLEPIVGGLDPQGRVWRCCSADGRHWAVKWTTRDTRFGLRLAATLARSGVPGVPTQLASRHSTAWTQRSGGRLSVSEWIDGREAFETGLTPREWQRLGRLLRQVHDAPPPPPETGGADNEFTAARRGIRRAGMRARRRLAEIDADIAHSTDRVPWVADRGIERIVTDWPTTRARLQRLIDVARRLKVSRRPTSRVSCHGDPHLGNVLVDDAGQPWLIDFDDAVRAPKEVDLVLIEFGVIFDQPMTDEGRRAFHDGYGSVEVDQDRVLRFACVRAVEDVVQTVHELLALRPGELSADLVALVDGILSDRGLVGLVEDRLEYGAGRIADRGTA